VCFVVSVAHGVMARKAFTFVLRQDFPPTIEMVVERFCRKGTMRVCCVWVEIGSHRICQWSAHWFPIAPDWAFPWVLYLEDTLFDHRLKCGRCEGMMAKTKFLYYPLVADLSTHNMNPTWRVKLIVIPPFFRDAKRWEKGAFKVTTNLSANCLMLIRLKIDLGRMANLKTHRQAR
jgi:hypothetical protein